MPEIEQYVYVIKPTCLEMLTSGPTPDEEEIVGQHFAYLQALTDDGVVILAGRTQTSDHNSFGIVILNAGSESEAHERMETDPAVKGDVMRAELFPFRIALKG